MDDLNYDYPGVPMGAPEIIEKKQTIESVRQAYLDLLAKKKSYCAQHGMTCDRCQAVYCENNPKYG